MSTAPPVEHILVIPARLFHEAGYFQGFCPDAEPYVARLLRSDELAFRPRPQMEQDPSFKQLIPYVIFEYEAPGGGREVFQYTRGTGQGESRLHALKSIGVGGHIASIDGAAETAYEAGMRRELLEEVVIDTDYEEACVGLINDDHNDVGRVHLGIVHRFRVTEPRVRPREPDLVDAGFRPVEALLEDLSAFETWSQICLKALYGAPQDPRA